MSYTNIALLGASGDIGTPILNAIIDSGKFKLTAVVRSQSSVQVPASVDLVKIDFNDYAQLVEALRGQDAVIITLGDFTTIERLSKSIIDAAIEVGVKRVIPSEFGHDLAHAPGLNHSLFDPKHKINRYLEEKKAQIGYTSLAVGVFFDWGLHTKFMGFDIPNRTVKLYGNGTRKVNATTLDNIAQSVVHVLSNPAPFANKHLRIHDFYVSQNEILAQLESITGASFQVEAVDVDALEENSLAALASGRYTPQNIYELIKAYLYGRNSSSSWGKDDDTVTVGLVTKDLRTEIQKVVDV